MIINYNLRAMNFETYVLLVIVSVCNSYSSFKWQHSQKVGFWYSDSSRYSCVQWVNLFVPLQSEVETLKVQEQYLVQHSATLPCFSVPTYLKRFINTCPINHCNFCFHFLWQEVVTLKLCKSYIYPKGIINQHY